MISLGAQLFYNMTIVQYRGNHIMGYVKYCEEWIGNHFFQEKHSQSKILNDFSERECEV